MRISAWTSAVCSAGLAQGQRVAVEVFRSCRECGAGRACAYRRCERNGLATMYGFVSVDTGPGLWGGYATHQYLAPDSMVLPVPDGLDPVVATLFNPLGAGIRWGATVPGTGPGDAVAVLGCGVRGLSAAVARSEEHTSELQSLMSISYAVFCLKKKQTDSRQ